MSLASVSKMQTLQIWVIYALLHIHTLEMLLCEPMCHLTNTLQIPILKSECRRAETFSEVPSGTQQASERCAAEEGA